MGWSRPCSPCLFLSAVWSGNYDRNGLVLGPLAVNNEGFPDQMSYVGCSSFRQASYPYNHHPFLTLLTTYDSDDDWLRKGMLMTDTQPLKTWVSRCYHITFGHKWCYLVSHLPYSHHSLVHCPHYYMLSGYFFHLINIFHKSFYNIWISLYLHFFMIRYSVTKGMIILFTI